MAQFLHQMGHIMRVFRAKPSQWALYIGLSCLFITWIAWGLSYVLSGPWKYSGLLLGPLFALAATGTDLLQMWRKRLLLDHIGLSFRDGKRDFDVRWDQITAVRLVRDWRNLETYKQYFLWITTSLGWLYLPLKYLDEKQIWRAIGEVVSPEKLDEQTAQELFETLPTFPAMQADSLKFIQSLDRTLRVRQPLWLTFLGALFAIPSGAGLIYTAVSGTDASLMASLGFLTAVGVIVLLPITIEMNAYAVTYTVRPFGIYQIRWDEIERIEFRTGQILPDWDWMVLIGGNKRIPLNGPAMWGGADRETMKVLLHTQIQARQIETRLTPSSTLKIFPKNAKISPQAYRAQAFHLAQRQRPVQERDPDPGP